MTDHNNLFGAVTFFKAATRAGIKPVLGRISMLPPIVGKNRGAAPHVPCRNNEGYQTSTYY